ncbi:AraC family transcriptional regulator [Phocaeicola vulgatus]|uniref:AraC family transcriptional regulator n=1 Tax=Phocaeicola vulgatus TaxID=821 RepID=UPI002869BA52|nr:AraC family transcriptional regulator [Phocaeicola vulgatus]
MEILSLPENEPFITGIEESIDICSNQIMKLADASIFHCRSGKAHIEIDLQAYEVTENTQLLLLPGSIFNCTCASHDFTVSYIVFSDTLFWEITSRLDPSFFHFLKEHPCIVIPEERVKPFIGLSLVMKDLYEDRDNSFRIQIFKNFIQNFILDFYDKTQHLFLQKKTEGINRQEEIFLKSATKLFSVLLASKRPLITELADKLRLKYPLLPTISPCPTMRLEAIRSIIPISCRRYPKSV